MAKETDLLKDPIMMASQRYMEQVEAFKTQYVPKPKRGALSNWAKQNGYRVEALRGEL
tara:strand:+ start:102 stop:275 length:174 start_codon:yes stop_codon:yes gene_type:complete